MVRGHHAERGSRGDHALSGLADLPARSRTSVATRSRLPFFVGEAMTFQSRQIDRLQPRRACRGNSGAGARNPKGRAENGVRGAAGSSRRRHVGRGHSGDPVSSACCGSIPKAPRAPDRDRLILSKGHASGALYATLAEAGFHSGRDASDLYEAAVDAERASEP